jgi:hypothetical protein
MLSVLQGLDTIIEFTALGAILMQHMPDHWVKGPKTIELEGLTVQKWSWGGFTPQVAAYYECILNAPSYKDCVSLME